MGTPIFHYRSDSLYPRINSNGMPGTMAQLRANATTAIALASVTTESGVFGSTFLDKVAASVARAPYWPGFKNTPSGAAFAILIRIIPRFTGTPPTFDLVNMSGSNGNGSGRLNLAVLTTGAFRLNMSDGDGQTAASVSTSSTYTSYVSGTAVDIFLTWDGTTSASAFSVYINGTLLQSVTAGSAMYSLTGQTMRSGIIVGNGPNSAISNFDLNELVIFDGTQSNPGLRAAFYTTTAFDASSYTFPADGDIRSGVTAINAGVTRTPSLVVPTLANTKTGVAGDGGNGTYDGSDRWSDPGQANTRLATAYKANSTSNNKTGTMIAAAAATTKIGTTADDGTGTYDGSERYTDFGNANIRSGQTGKYNSATNNRTGSVIASAAATTKIGTTADNGTGTYDGSERYTDFSMSDLRAGTVGKYNSGSNNRTGTMIANLADDVKHGVDSDGGTGTYRGYDLWDPVADVNVLWGGFGGKQDGVVVNGLYRIVLPQYVLSGVNFGWDNANSVEQVGTLDPGSTNVFPLPSQIQKDVQYIEANIDKIGTYDGSDRWTDLPPSKVLYGEPYVANLNNRVGALVGQPPDLRSMINYILRFIGESSITDLEFAGLGVDENSTPIDLYNALQALLVSRDSVSTSSERLTSYFEAKGIDVSGSVPPTLQSKITMGATLNDVPGVLDDNSNLFIGGEL